MSVHVCTCLKKKVKRIYDANIKQKWRKLFYMPISISIGLCQCMYFHVYMVIGENVYRLLRKYLVRFWKWVVVARTNTQDTHTHTYHTHKKTNKDIYSRNEFVTCAGFLMHAAWDYSWWYDYIYYSFYLLFFINTILFFLVYDWRNHVLFSLL